MHPTLSSNISYLLFVANVKCGLYETTAVCFVLLSVLYASYSGECKLRVGLTKHGLLNPQNQPRRTSLEKPRML